MRRGRVVRDPDPDEDDDEEEARTPPPRRRRSGGRRPVREWSADGDTEEGDEGADGKVGLFHRRKEPVFFRARDSVYFEPLVALAIIVVLLVALFAYTSNWPPMYVVESDSMQHGTSDHVGLINTGDLVLAQRTTLPAIQPYLAAMRSGYTTYGEFGDVILYLPNGLTSATPIIHRALLYLVANPDGTFNAPELAGLPCGFGSNATYTLPTSPSGCGTTNLTGVLTLHRIGWRSVNVAIDLGSVGRGSGFVTMGDNNFNTTNTSWGLADEPSLTDLVQPGWIVGVARGMIPWFGSIKLLLEGSSQSVPSESWEFMGITVAGLFLGGLAIHYAFRAEGIEDERRRRAEAAEADDEGEDEEEDDERSAWRHPLRLFRRAADEDDEEGDDEGTEPHRRGPRGGRPHPSVGRRPARGRGRGSRPERRRDSDL